MDHKLIWATELAEFVYCSPAWELKDLLAVEPSREAQLQIEQRPDGLSSRTEAALPLRVLVSSLKRKCRLKGGHRTIPTWLQNYALKVSHWW
jgi:hypothetical protein